VPVLEPAQELAPVLGQVQERELAQVPEQE